LMEPGENWFNAMRLLASIFLITYAALATLAGCGGTKGPSQVKPAEAYRADLFAITEKINAYLSANTPEDTARRELQETVGALAREYAALAVEAGPLQGKMGDEEYGVVAAQAEDGEIVAGNLAGALAADPTKKPSAGDDLAAAVGDWKTFNDELSLKASEDLPFNAERWWEAPPWRRALGAPGD
jgi:predicted small lipoprotein YifL